MLKKYALFIAVVYTLALTLASLANLKSLPKVDVSFGDKIFHFIAYSVLTYVWFNTLFFKFKFNWSKALIYSALSSVVFGIIIEALQGGATTYRAFDVYDALANALGVLITTLILMASKIKHIKKL